MASCAQQAGSENGFELFGLADKLRTQADILCSWKARTSVIASGLPFPDVVD